MNNTPNCNDKSNEYSVTWFIRDMDNNGELDFNADTRVLMYTEFKTREQAVKHLQKIRKSNQLGFEIGPDKYGTSLDKYGFWRWVEVIPTEEAERKLSHGEQ